MPHTEELALIICTLQIYNTTIHTSVGAETQEGRSLRGLAGWPAACSPGCQPLPICKTRVSFPSPSSLTLSFFLSFFLPISAPLFASSAIPPFHLLFFLLSRFFISFFAYRWREGGGSENRRAKYRATSGRNHLQIHQGNGARLFSYSEAGNSVYRVTR